MRAPMLFTAVSALVALLSAAGAFQTKPASAPEEPDDLTVSEILQRTAKAYAECTSYRDTGIAKMTASGRVLEQPFKTAFIRPDRFRFEYSESFLTGKTSRFIVWRKGEAIRSRWDLKPDMKLPDSLGLALAAATGVSFGVAHTIPSLLMPEEIGGRHLPSLTDFARGAAETIDGAKCYRLERKSDDGSLIMAVWIDVTSFLIRRHDENRTVTTYKPEINVEIGDELLEFEPPQAITTQPTGK